MVVGLKPGQNFNKVGWRAEMQIYPGGVLGGAADAFTGTRTEHLKWAIFLFRPWSIRSHLGVANLPYVLDTYEANTEFCRLVKDYMNNVMETKFNQKYLSSWSMALKYIMKKQVKTMEDFKGLVIACDMAIDAKSA
jgi:TRAP-type C4-dicarboxylate transport system substrate-binding protein